MQHKGMFSNKFSIMYFGQILMTVIKVAR